MEKQDTNKKHLVFILPSLQYGGAERFFVRLIQEIYKDYRINIILLINKGPLAENIKNKVENIYVLSEKNKLTLSTLMHLKTLLHELNPDIVQSVLDNFGRIFAGWQGIEDVFYKEANTNAYQTWFAKKMNQWAAKYTKKIVAISQAVEDDVIASCHINRDKFVIIPNGLDIEKLKLEPHADWHKPFRILIPGRLTKQKGHVYALQALSELKIDFEVTIAGEGELEHELKKLAKTLHINNKIKFIGPYNNIKELFKKADIVLMPSLWEGLGNIMLEAGIAGRPLIASDIDGPKEFIQNNHTGILVPPKDPQAIVNAINKYYSEPAFALQCAQNFQQDLIKKIDIKIIAEKYKNLWQR